MLVPAILAGIWAASDPDTASRFLPAQFRGVSVRHHSTDLGLTVGRQAKLAGQILTNNVQVSFVAFGGGVLAGFGTTLVLLYNGALIGGVAGLTVAAGRPGPFLSLVVPHGVLELSVIAVSGAAGFTVGWALIRPGEANRRRAVRIGFRRGAEILLGTLPWFAVAGLVEGFVTTTSLPLVGAVAVGLLVAAPYWSLVFWRGKPIPASSPPSTGVRVPGCGGKGTPER